MILIGHSAIYYPNFIYIKNIQDIKNTQAKDIIWFYTKDDKDYTLSKYCKDNEINYSVIVDELKDVIIFANLNAKYIIIKNKHLVEMAQKIADEYFIDSKILYIINDESSIENMAILGIDGIIFNCVLNTN